MNFVNVLKSAAVHTGVTLKKHSPEILVITGIIGTFVTTILACEETTKAQEVLKEKDEQLELVKQATEIGSVTDKDGNEITYTEKDIAEDKIRIYTKTAIKLAKTYAPAILTGILSTTSILAGYKIINHRAVTFAAAASALDATLKNYRGNVIERFGEKTDYELYHNIKEEIVTEVDPETGKEVTKTVKTTYEPENSIYSRVVDPALWNLENEDASEVRWHLMRVLEWAQMKFDAEGFLSLNQVYKELNYKPTSYGQFAGWVKGHGDQFISFGLENIYDEKVRDFINGIESTAWLDFNCIPDAYKYM